MGSTKELRSMYEMLKNLRFKTEKVTDMDKQVCKGMEYLNQLTNSLILFLEKNKLFQIQECLKMNISQMKSRRT